MEESELLTMAGVSSTTVAIVLFVYRVVKSMQGKTFISKCCGRKMDVGFTIREGETPTATDNPMILTVKHSPDSVDGHHHRTVSPGENHSSHGLSQTTGKTVSVKQNQNEDV